MFPNSRTAYFLTEEAMNQEQIKEKLSTVPPDLFSQIDVIYAPAEESWDYLAIRPEYAGIRQYPVTIQGEKDGEHPVRLQVSGTSVIVCPVRGGYTPEYDPVKKALNIKTHSVDRI